MKLNVTSDKTFDSEPNDSDIAHRVGSKGEPAGKQLVTTVGLNLKEMWGSARQLPYGRDGYAGGGGLCTGWPEVMALVGCAGFL